MKLSERILVVCLFVIIFVNIFLLSTNQLVIHEQIEPNNYFWPPGQDNTTPFNDTNFLTVIPRVGCDNLTKLIVGVRSIPSEFEVRKWIRNTWGKVHNLSTKIIFVIANHPTNRSINYLVKKEITHYNDILLLDYNDNYYNNTLKNFGFFEYALKYCKNSECVLKLDGDSVVNIPGFEKLCDVSPDYPLITGKVYMNSPVDRSPDSKWYVPRYVYPQETYPPYPYGLAQFISGKGALERLQTALRMKTPFNNSENYRRLPDDSIYLGEVRELAKIPLKAIGGIDFHKISYWSDASTNYQKIPLAFEVDNREEIWRTVQQSQTYITETVK